MRNEENIAHIVRDKRAITSLSLTKYICFLLIQHLSTFIVKMQITCNLIGWNSVHISDIFNCYRANINGMWNARKRGGIYKTFEFVLVKPKTYICRYRVNQHLIALNLDSVSINRNIAPEFATVKVSQDLNLM